MARDIYVNDIYMSQAKASKKTGGTSQARLRAPESLEDEVYTTKSDVWGFAMWVQGWAKCGTAAA